MAKDIKTKASLIEEIKELKAENEKLRLALNGSTALTNYEEAFIMSDIRFKGLINSIQDLVYTLDKDMNITGLYGMWGEMYGLSEELLLGKKLTAFLSPAQTEVNEAANRRALKGESVKYEWTLKFKNDKFHFESTLSPLYGSDDKIIGLVGVAREITDRKKSEWKLKESEEKYRNLIEHSPDPIILHQHGKIIFVNNAGIKLFGAGTQDELLGKNIYDFIRSDYHQMVQKRLTHIQSSPSPLPVVQEKFIRLDGSVIDVEVSTIALPHEGEIAAQMVVRDVSEKIRAQKQIQLQAELLNSAKDSIFLIDKNGKIVYANDEAFISRGYSDEEFLDLSIHELEYKHSMEMVAPKIEEIFEMGNASYEVLHQRKDGSTFPVEVNAQSITIAEEQYILSVNRDISERIHTNAALVQSESKFRSIFESTSVAILILGLDNIILEANNAFSNMLGYDRYEIIGRNILEYTHEDDRDDSLLKLNGAVHTSENVSYRERRYYNKNGEIVWGIASGNIVQDEDGIPLYVVGMIQDITDRIKANEHLRKISHAVQQSSSSIIITDQDGLIEYVNPKFSRVSGYSYDEVIGKNSRFLNSGNQSKEFYQNMWETLLVGKEWQGEFKNKKKSGENYWEYSTISPIKNKAGRITHFVAVNEDVTEWKKMQEELIRSREEAVEASKLKSSLLANMSHEFRTPLNGILGFAQLLKDEVAEKDHFDMVGKIIHSGRRLMNTLNSVLTITELENNDILISKSEVELPFFCRQMKSLFAKSAGEKNLNLALDIKDESLIIVTDESILTKVVTSIIDNAVKYTHEGEIKIELSSIQENNGRKTAKICVIDTGIGIREEDQSIIFKEFKQLSEGFRRDFEGLGLGLAMASKLVKLIRGSITVESTLGKGSKFTVTLPLEKDLAPNNVSIKKSSAGKTIPASVKTSPPEMMAEVLLVEDNLLNIEVVQRFLSKKCRVSFARDGKSALELANKNDYAFLLIDINLGHGMDGVQLLKEIKKLDLYKNKPVIALTGYASNANKKDFLSHGFTHYLAKPFEKRDLLTIVDELLNQ
ncbi:MAG: hypothetical protein CVV24_05850 [Ignavibacteriae bacterium HGW-Ignavibacteriae-3]|nr:MAG: hypothetical protein CVV24_05850 [Ignavibacteriae bacterium HGW-Ignavibacteriae-3]